MTPNVCVLKTVTLYLREDRKQQQQQITMIFKAHQQNT